MKVKALLILFLFASHGIFAQTVITNGQEVSGTWKKSESPYIIDGEAIVPKGKTLKIKKGVVVKFKTGTERDYRISGTMSRRFNLGFLRVEGKLVAKGSKDDRILFTRKGSGNWGNVFINSKDNGIVLKYCIFEYSFYIRGITESDNATGALSFYNSTGLVEYCIFRNNGWTALNCKEKSTPTFKNLTIVGNQYGFECNSQSTPNIINCIIWNNNTPFFVNGNSMPKVSYSLLQDKSLDISYDKGNNIYFSDPKFSNVMKNDYSITKGSPCYKTGKGDENIGAEQH